MKDQLLSLGSLTCTRVSTNQNPRAITYYCELLQNALIVDS